MQQVADPAHLKGGNTHSRRRTGVMLCGWSPNRGALVLGLTTPPISLLGSLAPSCQAPEQLPEDRHELHERPAVRCILIPRVWAMVGTTRAGPSPPAKAMKAHHQPSSPPNPSSGKACWFCQHHRTKQGDEAYRRLLEQLLIQVDRLPTPNQARHRCREVMLRRGRLLW